MANLDLEKLSRTTRTTCIQTLGKMRSQLAKINGHLATLLDEDSSDLKTGRIQQLIMCQAVTADKMSDLLTRIRDLEHYGQGEETQVGWEIVVVEEDGESASS